LIFIEGLRLCEEAQRSNLEIEAVIVSEELMRKARAANSMMAARRRSSSAGRAGRSTYRGPAGRWLA